VAYFVNTLGRGTRVIGKLLLVALAGSHPSLRDACLYMLRFYFLLLLLMQ
jgi:hypothetical protein